uniref:Uncharacterized protein n=1 Tax=Trichogramma kaykai TaxID=54128 RepID=A0ABD2X8V2_9HYME
MMKKEVEMETMKNFNSIRGAYTKIAVMSKKVTFFSFYTEVFFFGSSYHDPLTLYTYIFFLIKSRERGGVASSKPHIELVQSAKHRGNHRWQLLVISSRHQIYASLDAA